METTPSPNRNIVGFIDIGTNSIRLALVQIAENGAYTILSEQKETVRLGEGEFPDQILQNDAMGRAILVCEQFSEMARANQAKEIIGVATSATREAKNRREFIHALNHKANLDVKIIPGIEEARLIYLGISNGFDLKDHTALMIDIGGGSTELIVGKHGEYLHLDSVKLGAIRVSSLFFTPEDTGPVSPAKYELIKQYVKNTAIRALQRVSEFPVDLAIGSSGTIQTLAEIASQMKSNSPHDDEKPVSLKHIKLAAEKLCQHSLEDRAKLPGMNPKRADIIIGGSAILISVLEELGQKELYTTKRTLRDGMLVDYLKRTQHAPLFEEKSVRERSVIQLAKKCGVDEEHAVHVQKLALELFDSSQSLALHDLGENDRELLSYATLLHDVGIFLSYQNHQDHSYYLIQNADLVGFNQIEISIIAAMAYFHRKGTPKRSRAQLKDLKKSDQRAVQVGSTLLRIAEALDRSHKSVIHNANFSEENGILYLDVYSDEDYQLEIWRVTNHINLFSKIFNRAFKLRLFNTNQQPVSEIVTLGGGKL